MERLTPEFQGTERFELLSRLGSGGMGVVYQVRDRQRQSDVALKLLLRLNAEGIYKLKTEFRSLSGVSHPNLITLHELISEGDLWFFTMELLQGVDFLTWVRGQATPDHDPTSSETASNLPVDGETMDAGDLDSQQVQNVAWVRARSVADPLRLRDALTQLARAVRAIHAAGKLHRDLKPSNALVTDEGRVVVLDFGLVSDTYARRHDSQVESAVSGTPAYMAPEQATGAAITPASDWYAVGVILYEALTGQLPFHGNWFQLLDAKLHRAPPHPLGLVPQAPEDLAKLAMDLLKPDPLLRPNEAEILSRLGLADEDTALAAAPDQEAPFLGRATELDGLHVAQKLTESGRPVLAQVRGAPGIGKSTLVEQFLTEIRSLPSKPLVLVGRCYERETVPYKAFDSLIDALTRHLLKLTGKRLADVLPRDVAALGRIFPVLRRVPGVDWVQDRQADLEDKRGLRRRAFAALKELLRRLAAVQELVLALDDLQWSDLDSLELLQAVVEPPDAARMLIVLSWRDSESSRIIQELHNLTHGNLIGASVRDIVVQALSRQDSLSLAISLLDAEDSAAQRRAEVIVKESQGNPLFLVELARFRDTWSQGQETVTHPEVTLDQVLSARFGQLTQPARTLLDLVALAGKPVAMRRLLDAAQLGNLEQQSLQLLRNGHLIGTSGSGDADLADTYHNRIRDVAISLIKPDDLANYHQMLARAYSPHPGDAAGGELDVDALAWHNLGAGNKPQALHYSLMAARRAHAVYANHDAIRHYNQALRLLELPELSAQAALVPEVQEEAAEAARQAGEYARAAELLAICLDRAKSPGARADVHVGLGRVYQEKGDAESAILQLETALRLYGKRPPGSMFELVGQTVGQLLIHGFATLFGPPKHRAKPDPSLQKRADTMFSLIRIYYFIDVAKVLWAGVTTINMSRQFGRDADVALAWSFYGVLLFGMGMLDRAKTWCNRALDLARKSGDPVVEAVALQRLGTHALFINDLKRAERLIDDAIRLFKDVGEMWELQTALMLTATSRLMGGDFAAAEPIFEEMGQTGIKLNALMHQGWCFAWAPFCRWHLGREDAATTRAHLEHALTVSAQARDLANQCAALQHRCNLAVREGEVEEAAGLALRTYEIISRYLVQVPFLQIALVDAAEAALYALEHQAGSVSRRTLRKIATRATAKALRISRNYPYLLGPALRVRARWIAYTRGAAAAEPHFIRAIEQLEQTPNRWETAVAYYDAAVALPGRREEFRRRALRAFEEIGSQAEQRRLHRELDGDR